jgi:hypothetical protein
METQESKDSTTFIFVLVYRGGLPGSCISQGAISSALVTPRLGLGWSSRGSVGPKVARGWTILFPGISCSRRRSSSGVGARFLPGRASPGGVAGCGSKRLKESNDVRGMKREKEGCEIECERVSC